MLGVSNVSEINFKDASKFPSGYFDGINGSSARQIVLEVKPHCRGWAILPDKGRPADKVIITSGDNNSLVAVAR